MRERQIHKTTRPNRGLLYAGVLAAGLSVSACSLLSAGSNSDGPDGRGQRPSAAASKKAEPIGAAIHDPRLKNHHELFAYMQSNMTAKNCQKMDQDLQASKDKITRWLVAFAVPEDDGQVTAPKLNDTCASVLGRLAGDTPVSLAVGGWSTQKQPASPTADHKQFLERWDTIMAAPKPFSKSVLKAMADLSEQTGTNVSGIDLDYEFPTKDKTDDLEDFTVALRTQFPSAHLSMTVDCNNGYPDSFQAKLTKPMVESLNSVSVMSYARFSGAGKDYNAEFNHLSHHLAPTEWALDCNERWIDQSGDASKILMGVPAYGMRYEGVAKWGDSYSSREAVYFKDIPADSTVHNEYDGWLTKVNGALTTYVPAPILADNYNALLQDSPKLGGVMVWPARGMNSDFVDAVTGDQ